MNKTEIKKQILKHAFEYYVSNLDVDFNVILFNLGLLNCEIDSNLDKLENDCNIELIFDNDGVAIMKVKKVKEVNNND